MWGVWGVCGWGVCGCVRVCVCIDALIVYLVFETVTGTNLMAGLGHIKLVPLGFYISRRGHCCTALIGCRLAFFLFTLFKDTYMGCV